MMLYFAVEFWVAISGIISAAYYVVVGPLVQSWDEKRASKEFLVVSVGGGKPAGAKRGRVHPSKTTVFDSTMGFPGEDVAM